MPKQSLARRVDRLATLLEPQRRRLYEYVTQQLRPVSRHEAAAALGITRAMAAFHLDKLVDAGLLRADYRRLSGRAGRGAGRPSKLYRRSRRRIDVALPPRNHELLARLFVESADAADGSHLRHQVARDYGRRLGTRARSKVRAGASPQQQARCVDDVLTELGFEPIPTADGDVWTRNCPFEPLSRGSPDIVCGTALAIARGVVEGVEASDVRVDREDRTGWCCVVLKRSGSRRERHGRAGPKTAMDM